MITRHSRGFTLIELLIVIAIVGIIAALVLPNMLSALQKAKQKRTMGDIKIVGTALMAWLTDQAGGAAAAGAQQQVDLSKIPAITPGGLETILIPAYVQRIPEHDAWLEPYDFYLNVANPQSEQVLGVRSLGRDGLASSDVYTPGAFEPTDYDQDLVWVDGGFVRWPQRDGS